MVLLRFSSGLHSPLEHFFVTVFFCIKSARFLFEETFAQNHNIRRGLCLFSSSTQHNFRWHGFVYAHYNFSQLSTESNRNQVCVCVKPGFFVALFQPHTHTHNHTSCSGLNFEAHTRTLPLSRFWVFHLLANCLVGPSNGTIMARQQGLNASAGKLLKICSRDVT